MNGMKRNERERNESNMKRKEPTGWSVAHMHICTSTRACATTTVGVDGTVPYPYRVIAGAGRLFSSNRIRLRRSISEP
eukprot:scaffold58419_cov31-Prasinocladus_malaysianus.AAC.1